ncbi:ATP-binding protein [Panacagrimonas perspica]|nr:ATP-binding protein [Panacagrimonas perspica]
MINPRDAAIFSMYVAGYLALDASSYIYPVVPLGITPWNPSAGLSLFLLLTCGRRFWPAVLIAAVAADVVVRNATVNAPMLTTAAFITGCYVVAATFLQRSWKVSAPLESTRDLVIFFVVASAASGTVAVMFVGLYAAIGMVSMRDMPLDVLRYWVGDLNGILVLTPALFSIRKIGNIGFAIRKLVSPEIILQLLSIGAALGLILAFAGDYPYRSFYALFLPLIWISARWGLPGAAVAQVIIQLGLITCVQLADYHAATFVQLQWLMTGLCVTGLTIGAMSSHRARLELALLDRQAALNRAQQFASAGEMTSALAHQLNQPMTALNSYVGACQIMVGQPILDAARLRDLMAKIEGEVRRSSEVVARLRDFYRRGATNLCPIEAGRLVDNVIQVLHRNAQSADVEIVSRPGEWSRRLLVDTVQTENAIQNLLLNAIEAMEMAGSKTRRIETSISVTQTSVEIRIHDSGPGVSAEMMAELFEPFHTSKADGMGMGLAIARSLVRASGGDLWIEPAAAGGACFVMRLPAPTSSDVLRA